MDGRNNGLVLRNDPQDVSGVENKGPTGKGEEKEVVAVAVEVTLTSFKSMLCAEDYLRTLVFLTNAP